MKIPTKRYDLKELGYEGYWIDAPRTVREGFVHDMMATDEKAKVAEQSRDANLKLFELVSAWNLDDEEGGPLPLIREQKTRDKKSAVLAQIPLEVITWLARQVLESTKGVADDVKDF